MSAAENLPKKGREEISERLSPISDGPLPEKVRSVIWVVAISAFAIVLVGSFVTLAIGAFEPKPGDEKLPVTTGELLLSLFTSAVGFLAGLFIPSPAGTKRT